MSIFNKNKSLKNQPLFFGQSLGLARYDRPNFPHYEELTQKQDENFWKPNDIGLSKDSIDYELLSEEQKFIFTQDLSNKIVMDSYQVRGPLLAFLPWVSSPELEPCLITWAKFESIHAKSYQWMLNNVYSDPSVVFDAIEQDIHIKKRNSLALKYYEDFVCYGDNLDRKGYSLEEHKRLLWLALHSVLFLESISFQGSFPISYSFPRQTPSRMVGSADIIKLIHKDESLHLAISTAMIKDCKKDPTFSKIVEQEKSTILEMLKSVVNLEKEWYEHVFSKGPMLGMTARGMQQYIEYLANVRLKNLGYPFMFEQKVNNFTWIHKYTNPEDLQEASQEKDRTDYLINALDTDVEASDLMDF